MLLKLLGFILSLCVLKFADEGRPRGDSGGPMLDFPSMDPKEPAKSGKESPDADPMLAFNHPSSQKSFARGDLIRKREINHESMNQLCLELEKLQARYGGPIDRLANDHLGDCFEIDERDGTILLYDGRLRRDNKKLLAKITFEGDARIPHVLGFTAEGKKYRDRFEQAGMVLPD